MPPKPSSAWLNQITFRVARHSTLLEASISTRSLKRLFSFTNFFTQYSFHRLNTQEKTRPDIFPPPLTIFDSENWVSLCQRFSSTSYVQIFTLFYLLGSPLHLFLGSKCSSLDFTGRFLAIDQAPWRCLLTYIRALSNAFLKGWTGTYLQLRSLLTSISRYVTAELVTWNIMFCKHVNHTWCPNLWLQLYFSLFSEFIKVLRYPIRFHPLILETFRYHPNIRVQILSFKTTDRWLCKLHRMDSTRLISSGILQNSSIIATKASLTHRILIFSSSHKCRIKSCFTNAQTHFSNL